MTLKDKYSKLCFLKSIIFHFLPWPLMWISPMAVDSFISGCEVLSLHCDYVRTLSCRWLLSEERLTIHSTCTSRDHCFQEGWSAWKKLYISDVLASKTPLPHPQPPPHWCGLAVKETVEGLRYLTEEIRFHILDVAWTVATVEVSIAEDGEWSLKMDSQLQLCLQS